MSLEHLNNKVKEAWASLDIIQKFIIIITIPSSIWTIIVLFYKIYKKVFFENIKNNLIIILTLVLIIGGSLMFFRKRKFIEAMNKNGNSNGYKFIDGIIAVSAIIVDNENRYLLLKDEKDHIIKQPGTTYKDTLKKIHNIDKNDSNALKLITPYCQVISCIKKETGLIEADLEYLDISGFEDTKEVPLLDRLAKMLPSLKISLEEYEDHKLSPPPFLIMEEKPIKGSSEIKSTQELFHIDLYYAFKKKRPTEPSNGKFFSIYDIEKLVYENNDDKKVFKDILYVCNHFQKLYLRTRRPEYKIRTCTFNPQKKIICWRLLDICNSSCKFCLVGEQCRKNENNEMKLQFKIDDVIENLKDRLGKLNNNYKLIITGGEPFLCKELVKLIASLQKEIFHIDSISICTNAINNAKWLHKERQEKYNLINKISFTINLPAYDEDSYKSLTGNENVFEDVCSFINFLNEKKRNYTLNVVLTGLFKEKLESYIKFWKENGIKNIALSYIIRNEYNIADEGLFLSKQQSIDFYNIIYYEYDISFLEKFELILSDCGNKYCDSHSNIITIDPTGKIEDKCFEFRTNQNGGLYV